MIPSPLQTLVLGGLAHTKEAIRGLEARIADLEALVAHHKPESPILAVLRGLAQEEEFQSLTRTGSPESLDKGTELLLRFLAFARYGPHGYHEHFAPHFPEFLEAELDFWLTEFQPDSARRARQLVRKCVTATRLVFGENAFRRGGKPTGQVIKARVELMLWGFADLTLDTVCEHQEELRAAWEEVLASVEFRTILSKSTTDCGRVKRRFALWKGARDRVLENSNTPYFTNTPAALSLFATQDAVPPTPAAKTELPEAADTDLFPVPALSPLPVITSAMRRSYIEELHAAYVEQKAANPEYEVVCFDCKQDIPPTQFGFLDFFVENEQVHLRHTPGTCPRVPTDPVSLLRLEEF